MIAGLTQSEACLAPERLRSRAAELGVTLVRLRVDGGGAALGPATWVEQVIVNASLFAARVRSEWESLCVGRGKAIALWDGVWLAPLADVRRRRATDRNESEMVAGLMLGAELLNGEEFHAVCGERRLDHRATVAKVDPARLMTATEAARLAAVLGWMHEDAREIERGAGDTQKLSRELGESYEELSLLYRLSTSMTFDQPPEKFLGEALVELQEVVNLPWMALRLIDDEPRLEELAGRSFTAGSVTQHSEALAEIGKQLLTRVGTEVEPQIFDNAGELGIPALSALTGNLIVVPILGDGRPLAVVFGGSPATDQRQITTADAKLCSSLAGSLTIFLRNLMLYEDAQAMFLGTLHALTSAIDAKDSYTCGHSERVALVSKMLAEAAGLDAHTAERVYLAGVVHDLGKIGVPEAVLGKPGRLTDDEFRLIKLHPEIGARILQDIRQMRDLIPGVLHHHELWSGKGYPHGLAGEDIPLFGRLIGLADAFDAMSSNRTYRSALDRDRVLGEVRRCAGQQFDPKLAEVFLGLDFEPYDRLIRRHQAAGEPKAA